jgi:hypothetical protein
MKLFKISLVILVLVGLSACGQHSKELNGGVDPGRVVELKNTELVVRTLGNTSVHYIGDIKTGSCLAQTERVGWWTSNSVAIATADPTACGFPAKEIPPVVVLLGTKVPTTTVTPPKKVPPSPPEKVTTPCSCENKDK